MLPVTVTQCAVLAGGLGTRLGSLTDATPKPLLTRGGRPFLAWLLREFSRFGVTEFVLLTGHLSEEVERAARDPGHAAAPRDDLRLARSRSAPAPAARCSTRATAA